MTSPTEATTTRMTPLLARNDAFARTHAPLALAPPTAELIVVACLDHRVDPALSSSASSSATPR